MDCLERTGKRFRRTLETTGGSAGQFAGNNKTASNHGADLSAVGIRGEKSGAAQFDGRKSYIEIPHSQSLALGTEDFSVSLWVHTTEKMDDNLGDLITKYDPEIRRGFNLSLVNHAGSGWQPGELSQHSVWDRQ